MSLKGLPRIIGKIIHIINNIKITGLKTLVQSVGLNNITNRLRALKNPLLFHFNINPVRPIYHIIRLLRIFAPNTMLNSHSSMDSSEQYPNN